MTTINDAQFVFTKIIVADIERAYAFYHSVFGLIEIARISDGEGEMEMHEIIIGRAGEQGMPVPSLIVQRYPNKLLPPLDGVALGFTTTNIEDTIAKAVAAGASVATPVTTNTEHQIKAAFLIDPQGVSLELLQYL
jgi:lactoylglutathione lyase